MTNADAVAFCDLAAESSGESGGAYADGGGVRAATQADIDAFFGF